MQQWDEWRGMRDLPSRQDIRPLDVKSLLRDIFILDVDAQDQSHFRLAGTRLCTSFGRELRRTPFSALWQRIDQPEMMQNLDRVYRLNEKVALDIIGVTGCGHELAYEIALFPLKTEGHTRHVLGLATPKALPSWFGARPLIGYRAVSTRPTRSLSHADGAHLVHDIEDRPGGRRVGHLTVYQGGRSRSMQSQ